MSTILQKPSESEPPLTTLVIGQRGTGKTLYLRNLVRASERLLVINTFSEQTYARTGIWVSSPLEAVECMSRYPNFRLVACPESELGGRLYLHAALACGDCTVLIEEISQWCAPAGLSRELELLIRAGRHKNIRVLGASQRPADVHKLVMSQADLVLGRIYEANDTIYLRHFFREADRLKDLPEPEVRKEKGRLFLRAAFVRPLVGPDHFLIDLPI